MAARYVAEKLGVVLGADQRAGQFGVVLHQQPRGRLEQVDAVHEVVFVRADQTDAAVGESNDVEQQ